MRSGVCVIPFVVDVMGGIGSQSVEFLRLLDGLRTKRKEDRGGVAHTRPTRARLGWVSMAATRLSVAAQH